MDVFLTVLDWVVKLATVALGAYITLWPPKETDPRHRHWGLFWTFMALGVISVGLGVRQENRIENALNRTSTDVANTRKDVAEIKEQTKQPPTINVQPAPVIVQQVAPTDSPAAQRPCPSCEGPEINIGATEVIRGEKGIRVRMALVNNGVATQLALSGSLILDSPRGELKVSAESAPAKHVEIPLALPTTVTLSKGGRVALEVPVAPNMPEHVDVKYELNADYQDGAQPMRYRFVGQQTPTASYLSVLSSEWIKR